MLAHLKRLPCASLHLTLSQSSSYRATLIFLLVERFPFSQFIEHRFPLITSSFEPHWSISMYNLWLFLQILYKKSSKRKLLFNFCSPRRPCNKNKIDWNNGMWPWPSHCLTDGGQPSKTIENHGWGTQFSKFWPLFQSRIRENCNIKTKSNAMCERRGFGELSEG